MYKHDLWLNRVTCVDTNYVYLSTSSQSFVDPHLCRLLSSSGWKLSRIHCHIEDSMSHSCSEVCLFLYLFSRYLNHCFFFLSFFSFFKIFPSIPLCLTSVFAIFFIPLLFFFFIALFVYLIHSLCYSVINFLVFNLFFRQKDSSTVSHSLLRFFINDVQIFSLFFSSFFSSFFFKFFSFFPISLLLQLADFLHLFFFKVQNIILEFKMFFFL